MGMKPAQGELNIVLRSLLRHIPHKYLIHDDFILEAKK